MRLGIVPLADARFDVRAGRVEVAERGVREPVGACVVGEHRSIASFVAP